MKRTGLTEEPRNRSLCSCLKFVDALFFRWWWSRRVVCQNAPFWFVVSLASVEPVVSNRTKTRVGPYL